MTVSALWHTNCDGTRNTETLRTPLRLGGTTNLTDGFIDTCTRPQMYTRCLFPPPGHWHAQYRFSVSMTKQWSSRHAHGYLIGLKGLGGRGSWYKLLLKQPNCKRGRRQEEWLRVQTDKRKRRQWLKPVNQWIRWPLRYFETRVSTSKISARASFVRLLLSANTCME